MADRMEKHVKERGKMRLHVWSEWLKVKPIWQVDI
jgi:hypothetical protein